MRRRDEAVGKAIKTQRRKTLRRRNTAKAARRRKASVDANERIALLTRERDEAQERQTATAEVLKVISRSSVDQNTLSVKGRRSLDTARLSAFRCFARIR